MRLKEEILNTINILKSLSDLNRLRILKLLTYCESTCNCYIEESLELNQSNASRHLSKLKNSNLIIAIKSGKWTYYSLNKNVLEKNKFILDILLNLSDDIFLKDKMKFLSIKKNNCN